MFSIPPFAIYLVLDGRAGVPVTGRVMKESTL